MKFKQFMIMYDDWNGITKVNDDNLNTIVMGKTFKIMECEEDFNPMTEVESYAELFDMEVVAFGYDDELFYVRVK